MNDDALTAMALREHAQTCDDIARRAVPGSDGRKAWERRAERCRELARRHETASKFLRNTPNYGQLMETGLRQAGRCICGDAMRAIGEHRSDCPARGQA